MQRLTETAHFVDELLNRAPNPAQPYVGKHAFAHKAGLHAAGVQADPDAFEHTDPELVGNQRDILISELAGRATVLEKAREAGIELDDGRRGAHGRARQGARARGLSVRGRRRLLRAA